MNLYSLKYLQETGGSGNSKWDEIFNLIDPATATSIAGSGNAVEMLKLKLSELIPQGKDYFHYQVK